MKTYIKDEDDDTSEWTVIDDEGEGETKVERLGIIKREGIILDDSLFKVSFSSILLLF